MFKCQLDLTGDGQLIRDMALDLPSDFRSDLVSICESDFRRGILAQRGPEAAGEDH